MSIFITLIGLLMTILGATTNSYAGGKVMIPRYFVVVSLSPAAEELLTKTGDKLVVQSSYHLIMTSENELQSHTDVEETVVEVTPHTSAFFNYVNLTAKVEETHKVKNAQVTVDELYLGIENFELECSGMSIQGEKLKAIENLTLGILCDIRKN